MAGAKTMVQVSSPLGKKTKRWELMRHSNLIKTLVKIRKEIINIWFKIPGSKKDTHFQLMPTTPTKMTS